MVFRYPGGKTKLLRQFEHLLDLSKYGNYYEPFVGGGSVAIHVAQKNPDIFLHLNDLDIYMYNFWKMFELNNDESFESLYALIRNKPTVELFNKLRNSTPISNVDYAYRAIFFNRTTFSGIFDAGPIGGFSQSSKWKIDCRYNIDNIIKKIEKMRSLLANRISVSNKDFRDFIPQENIEYDFMYLDPPYFLKGEDLYQHFFKEKDHLDLRNILSSKQNWLLSYDNCDKIKTLYRSFSDVILIDCQYSISGEKKTLNYTKEIVIMPIGDRKNE